jgi:hypothetical protein
MHAYKLQYAFADNPTYYLTWSEYTDRHEAERDLARVQATDASLSIERTWRVYSPKRAGIADLIMGWRNEA